MVDGSNEQRAALKEDAPLERNRGVSHDVCAQCSPLQRPPGAGPREGFRVSGGTGPSAPAGPEPGPWRCRRFRDANPEEIEALTLEGMREAVMAQLHAGNLEVPALSPEP